MAFQIKNKDIFFVLYHSYSRHREFHNIRAIKQSSCYNVKLAVDYSTCAIKFWLVPGYSPKNLGYFQIFFKRNENKIEINSTFWLFLCLKLIWSKNSQIEIRQVHKGSRFFWTKFWMVSWFVRDVWYINDYNDDNNTLVCSMFTMWSVYTTYVALSGMF